MAFPNPFYQIYEGVQIANNARVIYMPLHKENNFKPHLIQKDLQKVDMVILNSPNNPTGQALSLDDLITWVKLAIQYDFILINDECYSEIYVDTPPASLLQASIEAQIDPFKNLCVVNASSLRLSAPGLRRGVIAGEREIVEQVTKAALQLNHQENRVRKAALNSRRKDKEDEAYKSYGVLKYARKITERDARIFLSILMEAEASELIHFKEPFRAYAMIMEGKPANTKAISKSSPMTC